MKDWQKEYESKLVSAEEAVRKIPNGCQVHLGHAAGEPAALVEAMVANYEQYENVRVSCFATMGKGDFLDPEMEGHFFHTALFGNRQTRPAIHEGRRADYVPMGLYQGARSFADGTFPIDVALISVTPPNEEGYVSLGVSVCATRVAAKNAKMVIAQVNDQMPWTLGRAPCMSPRSTGSWSAPGPCTPSPWWSPPRRRRP